MSELNESRRAVLQAVCNTVVPSIPHDPDPTGLWARSATDMGADQGIEQVFGTLPEEQFAGMMELLDGLGAAGLHEGSRSARASRSCATSRWSGRRRRPASRRSSG